MMNSRIIGEKKQPNIYRKNNDVKNCRSNSFKKKNSKSVDHDRINKRLLGYKLVFLITTPSPSSSFINII